MVLTHFGAFLAVLEREENGDWSRADSRERDLVCAERSRFGSLTGIVSRNGTAYIGNYPRIERNELASDRED